MKMKSTAFDYDNMFYQYVTTSSFSNLYISCTVKNLDFIIQFNNEKKNQMRKYYKLIKKIEIMANI